MHKVSETKSSIVLNDLWPILRLIQRRERFLLAYSGGDISAYPPPRRYKMLILASEESREKQPDKFTDFSPQEGKWYFGFLSYDLKNQFEQLSSENSECVSFPDYQMIDADYVLELDYDSNLKFSVSEKANPDFVKDLQAAIKQTGFNEPDHEAEPASSCTVHSELADEDYLRIIEEIKEEIRDGEVYEMNFCRNYRLENLDINPLDSFLKFASATPTPFSCLLRTHEKYLISASMERFLYRDGRHVVSQPIKGTSARMDDPEADLQNRTSLLESEKERAENLMIVDLVRNDLNKSAERGSVKVDELFGIYSFPTVHQMISTVSCTTGTNTGFVRLIQDTFPMGSMTGAPKLRAMELIEEYENFRRGLYSGAVGYIKPNSGFDFNVVIRSLLYDKTLKLGQVSVGSAITSDSEPMAELKECQIKVDRLFELLGLTLQDL